MIQRSIMSSALLLILVMVDSGCINTSDRSQPQEGAALVAREEAGPPKVTVRVPDDAEMQEILQIQHAIIANPQSDSLRRELGRRAMDAGARVIWTVGTGRVTDPTSAIAISNAERAAWIDGNRWAAYLIEWQKNNFSTEFGSVQTQVPGSMVERKSMSDSLCVVLVKTSMP